MAHSPARTSVGYSPAIIKRSIIWLNLVALSLLISAKPAQGAMTRIIVRGADDIAVHTVTTSQDEDCPPFDREPGFTIQGANGNCCKLLGGLPKELYFLIDQVPYRIILVRADDNRVVRIRYPAGLF